MNQSKRRTSLVTLCVVFCWQLVPVANVRKRLRQSGLRSSRLAVLAAEDRRAPDARRSLRPSGLVFGAAIRKPSRIVAGRWAGSNDPISIADILPVLEHPLPEIRSEAATAVDKLHTGDRTRPRHRSPQGRTSVT